MKKTIINFFITSTIFLLPVFSFAEKLTFKKISKNIYNDIFVSIIDLLFIMAFVFFAWSVFRVVTEVKERDEAKKTMFWGVIALFVMASVWGLIGILDNTFFNGESSSERTRIYEKYDLKDKPYYNPDLSGSLE